MGEKTKRMEVEEGADGRGLHGSERGRREAEMGRGRQVGMAGLIGPLGKIRQGGKEREFGPAW